MSAKKVLYCSFCGKSQHEVRKLIAGPTVFICDECVELCMSILREEQTLPRDAVPTRADIHKVLDRSIDGQYRVKQVFSVVLHRHYRCFANVSTQANTVSSPTNILLSGPSMGRSEIARALMRCLTVPFVVVDATKLLEIREARDLPPSIIGKLLYAANYNVGRAQHGIVYIDDFDQLGRLAGKLPGDANRFDEEVQKAIISLMKGAVVDVTTSVGITHTIGTKMIMFIFVMLYVDMV